MRNPISTVFHFLGWLMDGVESGPVPRRLAFLALSIVVLLVVFVIVVEVRCLFGWISEDECHAWE